LPKNSCDVEKKDVRSQGANRYKRKVHLLKNVGRKEYVTTQKTDKQIEGILTPWRRSGTKLGYRRKLNS